MASLKIEIDFHVRSFEQESDAYVRDVLIPASVDALNTAAEAGRLAVVEAMPAFIDRLTPFTLNAISVFEARAVDSYGHEMSAYVYVMPQQARYLEYEILGLPAAGTATLLWRHGPRREPGVVIGGARYAGGTAWTDYRLGSYSLTHAFRTAEGRNGMVDYRRIRAGPRSRNRIEPREILAMRRAARAFIVAELARPHDGPTVVVTHHAPHPASLPDPHADLSWCYASDFTDLMMDDGLNL